MSESAVRIEERASRAFYANFSRRLHALSIDSLVIVALTLLVVALAPRLEGVVPVRVALFLAWWSAIFLYEPIMVWRGGGTFGHRAMNLQVVDDRTLANVSLPKALARFVLKAILGIVSFLTMRFSRRHRAMHDIATGSSVRIRRPERALRHHYTEGAD